MVRSTKTLWVLGLLLVMCLLIASCAGPTTPTAAPTLPPAPTSAAPTQAPTQAVPPTQAATTAPSEAPTTAPPPTEVAASPTPIPFTATIRGYAVNPHMNFSVPRADDPAQNAKLMTTGLNVVPPGVPALFQAGAIGMAQDAKLNTFTWSLKGPDGSTAKVAEVTGDRAKITGPGIAIFTPDKTGTYTLTLTVKDDKGNTSQAGSLNVEVARYVGVANCEKCHADQAAKWQKTGHATFFTRMVDTDPEKEYKDAGFGCARCHTVGYYNITQESTGGWWDVAVNVLKFKWPTDKIGQPGTFENVFPKELQAVSNIQCENCHGPGGNHNGDPTKIATSMFPGQCDQCHNDGHFHIRGEQLESSVHAENANLGFAAARAECARCHSSGGFVDFVGGKPQDQQRKTAGPVACATCHDPHGNGNTFQVRVSGDVKGAPIEIKDQGQSALCETCHNGRTTAEAVVTEKPEFPHYSAAAESINQAGGYDFGMTIPNSPHNMIGAQAGENGVKPGPCVACHMFETPGGNQNAKEENGKEVEVTDETNPGHNLVGAHSFNMAAIRSNGQRVENVAACQQCHNGITTFDFPAKADYDGNGKIDGVETEVKGLMDLLQKTLTDKGVKFVDGYPYFTLPENASTELKGAAYNWRFVIGVIPTGQGRASAIHNFKRTVSLLQISYLKVTGSDVPGATLLYK